MCFQEKHQQHFVHASWTVSQSQDHPKLPSCFGLPTLPLRQKWPDFILGDFKLSPGSGVAWVEQGELVKTTWAGEMGMSVFERYLKVVKISWCGVLVGISSFCSSRSLSFKSCQSPTAFNCVRFFCAKNGMQDMKNKNRWGYRIQELHFWGLARVTKKGCLQF